MRFVLPFLSTLFCGWVGMQAMDAAADLMTDHQRRQSAAFCQVDASYCADR
jgi:hypothetical protein